MKTLFKNSFFSLLFLCFFFTTKVFGVGIVPVYVHDFEGHAGYTDMNIQNLICELNRNFESGGLCTTNPEYSGIRFSLQGITRHAAPSGGSGLTPTAFMTASGGGSTVSLAPSYGIHIFLYDFTGGVGAYLIGSGYSNVVMLSLSGFTGHTLTHEMGHAFGLAHITPGSPSALQDYYSATTCTYPWSTSGISPAPASNNFMVTSTGPGSCMFTPNQVKIMACNYDKRWKPVASVYSSLVSSHSALIASASSSAPYVWFTGGGNFLANFSVASSCSYGFLFYTYSIDYCGDAGTSIYDCDNCPVTGSSVSLQPCATGYITVFAHYSYGINSVTYKFDTRTPGCVVGFSCDLVPGGEASRLDNGVLGETEQKLDVSLYPTLAQDDLNIVGISSGATYSIFDLNGKVVLYGILDVNKISVSNIPTGTYILRFSGSPQVLRFSKL